jgi:hypothetical protein
MPRGIAKAAETDVTENLEAEQVPVVAPEPQKASGLPQALANALRQMGPVRKDAANGAFKGTKYATLQSVLETVVDTLLANDILILQPLGVDELGNQVLDTVLIHIPTNQQFSSRSLVPCAEPNNPQKMGGAITYFRRYGILSILSLAAEDDDGNAASQPGPTSAASPNDRAKLTDALKKRGIATNIAEANKASQSAYGVDYQKLNNAQVTQWLKQLEGAAF